MTSEEFRKGAHLQQPICTGCGQSRDTEQKLLTAQQEITRLQSELAALNELLETIQSSTIE